MNVLCLLCVRLIDKFHRVCRCSILIAMWLHFDTSACLIRAPRQMLMWARDHVSCSDSGSEFEDPILFCTDDDDGDDAECILFGGLFCHVCPVHTAQKAGSLSLFWELTCDVCRNGYDVWRGHIQSFHAVV